MKKLAITSSLFLLAGVVLAQPDGFLRARALVQLTACKSNEQNIATVLEMHATDYPGRLSKRINQDRRLTTPTCPSVAGHTYSSAYKTTRSTDSPFPAPAEARPTSLLTIAKPA